LQPHDEPILKHLQDIQLKLKPGSVSICILCSSLNLSFLCIVVEKLFSALVIHHYTDLEVPDEWPI